MQTYREAIAAETARLGRAADPRHVEAFMRIEHPTLDALSPEAFALEVRVALDCVEMCGERESEAIARSFGY